MDVSSSNPVQSGAIRDQHKVQAMDHSHRKAPEDAIRQAGVDEVAISQEGRLLQRLKAAIDETPDVREEKVAALRDAIEQGRYHVSAAEIAKALLATRGR